MLEQLDKIDWATFSHAYGSAEDVPAMIRALRSPDPETRELTLDDLFSTIWHQGTVDTASAPAVPFLIELTADASTPDRANILYLLHSLAEGSSYIDVHERLDPEGMAQVCIAQGSDLETERSRERAWVQAAHDAVSAGLPIYLDLLADSDPRVRNCTLYLLAALPEHAPAISALLRPMLIEAQEPSEVLGLLRTLRALAGATAQDLAVFERVLHDTADSVARLVAAVALVERLGEAAPATTIEILVDATRRLETDTRWLASNAPRGWSLTVGYLPEPWGERLLDLVVGALSQLSPRQYAHQLIRALGHTSAPDMAHDLATALLDRLFGAHTHHCLGRMHGAGPDRRPRITYRIGTPATLRAAHTLTAVQRAVVAAIAHCDAFWQIDTNLLACYELPADRVALQAWRRQVFRH
jgi:HEAT repeat protein